MEQASKGFWWSKTFWSNLILLILMPILSSFLPEETIKQYLTADNVAYLFAGVNFLLRLFSKDKVTLLP